MTRRVININAKTNAAAKKTQGLGPTGAPRLYDSRAEAIWASTLNARMAHGQIRTWIPQVSLECGIGDSGLPTRLVADALIILELRPDGSFVGRFADRKGVDTEKARAKRCALRSIYGIDVELT